METIKLNTEYLHRFVSDSELSSIQEEVLRAKKVLLSGSGRGNDFLGWIDLPEAISQEILDDIKSDVNDWLLRLAYSSS